MSAGLSATVQREGVGWRVIVRAPGTQIDSAKLPTFGDVTARLIAWRVPPEAITMHRRAL